MTEPPSPQAETRDGNEGTFDPVAHFFSSASEPRRLRELISTTLQARRMARRAGPRVFYALSAVELVIAVTLAAQVILGKLALSAIITTRSTGRLGPAIVPLIGFVAASAVSTLATSGLTMLQRLQGELVQRQTWESILDVTTSVELETFESPAFFDELQRVEANALIRPLELAQGLTQVAAGSLGVIGLSIALIVLQPILLPILLLTGIPLWLLSRRTGRLEFQFALAQTHPHRVRHYLIELLCGRDEAKEIRVFGLGPMLLGRWSASYDRYIADLRVNIRRRLMLDAIGAVVTVVLTSTAMGVLIDLIATHHIALADAGAAVIAVRLLSTRIQTLFAGIASLFEANLFLEDLQVFLRRRPQPPARAVAVVPRPVEVRAEALRFTYPGSDREALRGIDVTLRAGEVVALVGENGSGKTTLAKLLAHALTATDGRILWDGVDSRGYAAEDVRRHVAVIFQDFVQYHFSAADNVAVGEPDQMGDRERVLRSARRAGADAFVRQLPDAYETMLGKIFGGYDLSLGQWQRIALARGFFRDAGLLVLDEPTASMDPRAEHELFDRMRDLAQDRMVLLISHRFSTVRSADRIYVMHDGEIVEQGGHEELVALGGRYAELFSLQATAYR